VLKANDKAVLVKAIGRWSLAALVINSIIGSGIFGLPSIAAEMLGRKSTIAVLLAGAAVGVIMACYAEVASQFTQAGGPYLYARVAFGRLAGIEMGWLLWLAQLAAPAANANLFVVYLGQFWRDANRPLPRFVILTVLVGALALVNYRGVNAGTKLSNVFTAAKLVPLVLVIAAAALYVSRHAIAPGSQAATTSGGWLKAMLLLFFAYGGFETALTPMSEAKNPRRDTVFALFTALIVCTVLYTLIQWAVVSTVTDPAHSERPLADVAQLAFGRAGAAFIAGGGLICFYGYLSAKILAVPRVTLALAEEKDFPSWFGRLHPQFHTPYVSILIFSVLVWMLALFGNFAWNVTLSAVARLFYYGAGCAALPVLRRKQPSAAWFRLPAGNFFAALGVLICIALITKVDLGGSLILVAVIAAGFVNWLAVRRTRTLSDSTPL